MESGFWKKLKKPIMAMAPMSGISNEAFRLMFLKYGKPSVFWTEFVSADGLFSRGRSYCLEILKFHPKEHPIVAQIFGGEPLYFEKAAREIAELGFDGIDINMGCPDKDIEKKGGGAALMKNPALAKEIIRAVKRGRPKGYPEMPVSVKTRIGYDKNQIAEWIPALLEEDIAALIVHLRTKKEMYGCPAHWELAEKIVKLRDKYAPKTLIIGNGDVKSLAEAKILIKKTGLDGIMVGRNLIGNPWFFSDKIPSIKERLNAVIKHAEIFDGFHKKSIIKNGHYKEFESLKKHFHGYVKGFSGAKELRDELMKVKNTKEAKVLIKNFLK